MADFLTFVSAVIIVVSFLILGRFIIRLGIMEREAIFDYVNPPPREIPSQSMVGVKNPFMLKLKTADQTTTTRTGTITKKCDKPDTRALNINETEKGEIFQY